MAKQSETNGKPLAYFAALNTILMVINTNLVTSKEWMTIVACLIGPLSWMLAWYAERWLILNAPSSLEEAQFERANNDVIAEVTAILKDKKLSPELKTVYSSMLNDAKFKKAELLLARQKQAFKNASENKLTRPIPPFE